MTGLLDWEPRGWNVGLLEGIKSLARIMRGFHALGLFVLLRAGCYPLRVRLAMVCLGVVGGLVVDASFSWELFPKVVACDCIRLVASI